MRLFLAAIFVSFLAGRAVIASGDVERLHSSYEELLAEYSEDLTRSPSPATGELLLIVEDQYSPNPSDHEPPTARQISFANQLFALARRAAEAGEPSLAFQWATEVVHANADHADARRVLGYEQFDGQWLTFFARRMVEQGKTWHPRFGWIVRADVARWEAGERPFGRGWISAEDDRERHQHIDDGWNIRTDHFLVGTNHSIEAGVELAARLERLFQVWRQQFAGFYLSDREVRQLFAGARHARQRSKPFQVIYHRDRDEYVAALRRRQPRIAETLGIYFDTQREAHFFASIEADDEEAAAVGDYATLYHEAVHQLFQESQRSARHIGEAANFWVIEGVATYFESLQEFVEPSVGRYFTIGEASRGRLPAARQRALDDDFYVPLAALTRLGKLELQRHPDLAKVYSQSAGLATFLMQAEAGRYRESLVRYLRAVYAGRDHPDSLADITGSSYAELDVRYRTFLESLP